MSLIRMLGSKKKARIYGKDGRELEWSGEAMIWIDGGHAVAAEIDVPRWRKIEELDRHRFGRLAHWALPGGDPGEAAGLIGEILFRLRMVGRLPEESYIKLEREAVGRHDPDACRLAIELGLKRRFWIRAIGQDGKAMRAADPAAFDPAAHGLAWLAPTDFPAGMDRAQADVEFRSILECLTKMESEPDHFSLYIAKVRQIGEGAWETVDDFVRTQEGIRGIWGMDCELGRYRKEKRIMSELERFRAEGVGRWH